MEYLSPERRTLGLNLTIGIFYCIGTMSAPWIAVICSDWRTFLRATSAPLICIIVYWFVVNIIENIKYCNLNTTFFSIIDAMLNA